ncbi:hypothetical protein G8C92_08650 [Paenibacillus donghaensis]|uniref:hypothetical protein n=1 Tax=Paenibacillus donghaensis TaxID=414771 RepID=UPI00188376BE|nr:hypothetical protein [Paenibacillus donghaensis]MBE9914102.1 hypothetical protein [Paenibacillus donghaensis]
MNWNYFESDEAYEAAEQYWKNLFFSLMHEGDTYDWVTPYYNNQLADGTRMRDGNPIFSAVSRSSGRSIRIVIESDLEYADLTYWVDQKNGKNELVVVCGWTLPQLSKAEEVLGSWLGGGKHGGF